MLTHITYLWLLTTSRIYEGMKDLCTRFCHEELLARLKGDTVPKQIENHDDPNDDDFYEQEETEEEE
jgi:hypothetical protein